MSKLLVIIGNPNSAEHSFGVSVSDALVEEYKTANPSSEVTELHLFDEFVPEIDGDVLGAWGALAGGTAFADLTEAQQTKVGRMQALLQQFMAHDNYVFVTPMWNFSFPARVKMYLDTLCVAGTTFKYTEKGPVGLLENKKAVHIHASGGVHEAMLADDLLKGIMSWIGVKEYATVKVEGQAATPDKAGEIKEEAKKQARALVTSFFAAKESAKN